MAHDDLVFAAALAYWAAGKLYPEGGGGGGGDWRFGEWRECEREFQREMERRRAG